MCFSDVGGAIFETGFERALLCDSEISARPLPGDRIRLGGRNWEVRMYCNEASSVAVLYSVVWVEDGTEFSSE